MSVKFEKKNVEPKLCLIENSKSRAQINSVATDEEMPYLDLCGVQIQFCFFALLSKF